MRTKARLIEWNWLPPLTVALVAGLVVILMFGWAPTETELPNTTITRDAVVDYWVVEAALGTGAGPTNIPRTPGSIAWLLPHHLVPVEYSTWAAAMINVATLGILMWGVVRLTPGRHVAHMLTAITLPASLIFLQTIYHGNAFFLLAAAIVWGWVFLEEGRDIPAGILIGLAGAARLWPMLLVFVAVKYRRTRTVVAAAAGFVGLTSVGLALPGVTIQSSLAALTTGGTFWVAEPHNGSLAGVLHGQIPAVAASLLVLGVWTVGMKYVPDIRTAIGWTAAAAMFASPLAWIGYLIVLIPAAQKAGVVTGVGLIIVQTVGYKQWTHRAVFLVTFALLVALVLTKRSSSQPVEVGADPFSSVNPQPATPG